MITLRRRAEKAAPPTYASPDALAELAQSIRGELLAWGRRSWPTLTADHEEVLQDTLAAFVTNERHHGDENHVRACLYHLYDEFLNKSRRRTVPVDLDPSPETLLAAVPSDDATSDPEDRALRNWHRDVVEDLLAGYTADERAVIRLRYRGGERAKSRDGIVTREQCAAITGLEVRHVRSIEDAILRRFDQRIAAYTATSCDERADLLRAAAKELEGRTAQGRENVVQLALAHARVCASCRHEFAQHRLQFREQIAILVPLPAAAAVHGHHGLAHHIAGLLSGLRSHLLGARDTALVVARDPGTITQLSNPRGGAAALLAACGLAAGGAGACTVAGISPLAGASAIVSAVSHHDKPDHAHHREVAARTPTSPARGSASSNLAPAALLPAGLSSTPTAPSVSARRATSTSTRSAPARRHSAERRANGHAAAHRATSDQCIACAEHAPSPPPSSPRPARAPTSATAAASSTAPEVSETSTPALAHPAPPAPQRPVTSQTAGRSADPCEACAEH